ncbi:MAG: hypothetical protein J5606_09960 [Bacteroidales bacterium]|nr:hypothetical protein [Bacteroidales bacterium]
MKRYCLFFLLLIIGVHLVGQNHWLKNGDLLFQVNVSSALSDAIAASTTDQTNITYTHVGIVCRENDTVFVIEATTPCVVKTPLDSFLNNSAFVNGKPLVAVARLKPRVSKHVDLNGIVQKAYSYIGCPYDYVYTADNNAYYCSELVYVCYIDKKQKPIFNTIAMTFKEGNHDSSYWTAHFAAYNTPVPEGQQGTNPQQLSQSKKIHFVFRFF